ncbi:MAG: ABC transporter substrate-binding protein [Rhodospirillales bacterium]|nr:ABC transporter substrate-binding protein [Rhodospirillales bacterium]
MKNSIGRRAVLAGSAGLLAAPLIARHAGAAGLRTIRFGIGLKAMSAIVINTVIGEELGYNKAEGLIVKPMALGNNTNVQLALDRGDIDIGIGVPSFQMPLLAKGEWQRDVNFYEYTYPYKWDIAVKPGSPIHSYGALKGKKIGVSDFGATDYPVTKSVLRSIGLDPDKDVKWIAVGNGVPAGVALERGDIDALAYYDAGFGQIEAAGIKLAYLPRPKNLPMVGGQFLMAPRSMLAKERETLIGFGRGICKSSQYILASPEAGARAFLKMYPETAPRGASEAQAVAAIMHTIGRRIKLYRPPYAGAKMGSINPAEFIAEAKLDQLKIGLVASLYTNALIDPINHFDLAAVQKAAKAAGG